MDKIKYILTLLNLPGVGRKSVYKVLKIKNSIPKYGDDIVEEITYLKERIKRLKIPTRNEVQKAVDKAQEIIDKSLLERIAIIPITDERFPEKLAKYSDPPVIIYVKGDINCLKNDPAIAVIGTREPTEYGAECCNKISQNIAEHNITIISGLAKGCDSIAHRACLEKNCITIAILAHGLHMIYPAENKELAQKIIDSGGCLVSEYPIGTEPRPNYFIERDRLQTALSNAVFFAETDIKGGTMHAVKACIAEGKPLACLKHPEKWLTYEKTKGNQILISEKKAIPIADVKDLELFLTKKMFETRDNSISNKVLKYKQLELF